MKSLLIIPIGIACLLLSSRAIMAGSEVTKLSGAESAKPTIVETAVAAGSFNTLVTAVKTAGLVETLSGPGPFTVFAPTDEAFAKLPAGAIAALLADSERLTSVLTYHVAPGKLMAADVVKLSSVSSVNGASASIATTSGVMIDGAKIIKTDIECSNGVIHVIDAVIMPKDIIETATAAGQFQTLAAAIEAAGLTATLKGRGPFTVFAPNDAAFAKLPKGTVEGLLADKEKLSAILTYHVIAGRVSAAEAKRLSTAKSVQGGELAIEAANGIRVNGARVIAADVGASNGVIHVIDQVLLPPTN